MIVITAAALAVLSACANLPGSLTATVPTSGPIRLGPKVNGQGNAQIVRVIARPPEPGMTPSQIVQGFLDASASFVDDHAVAREYLSASAAATWDPSASVGVYDGASSLVAHGDVMTFAAPAYSTIAGNGAFTLAPTDQNLIRTFHLVRVGAEWRIAQLAQGLVLSLADTSRSFLPASVYFYNRASSMLVPDPRMVPATVTDQVTALMQMLLRGPSAALANSVRSALPTGSRLLTSKVAVIAGVAQIHLSGSTGLLSPSQQVQLASQVAWTLRQALNVASITITVGGQLIRVPGTGQPLPLSGWAAVSPGGPISISGPYVATSAGVVTLGRGGIRAVAGPAGRAQYHQLAVSTVGSMIAGLTPSGSLELSAMTAGAPVVTAKVQPSGSQLAFASDGELWLVTADHRLVAVSALGAVREISVAGLPAGAVLISAVPAADRARAALVVRMGAQFGLYIASAESASARGRIQRLTFPHLASRELTQVVSVTWTGGQLLQILGTSSIGGAGLFELDLGNNQLIGMGAPNVTHQAAGAVGRYSIIATSDARLFELKQGAWIPVGSGTWPAYPS